MNVELENVEEELDLTLCLSELGFFELLFNGQVVFDNLQHYIKRSILPLYIIYIYIILNKYLYNNQI